MRIVPVLVMMACVPWVACKRTDPAPASATKADEPAGAAPEEAARVGNFATSNPFPSFSIVDHGRDCAEALGTTVPEFSCLDGALLEVFVDGKPVRDRIPARCDNPDLVDPAAACVPGDRLLRIDQGDTTTMIMCRRFRPDLLGNQPVQDLPAVWPVDDPRTDNVSMIHFNRRTKAACFYQIRQLGMVATKVSPPYSAQPGWTGQELAVKTYVAPGLLTEKDACVRCHDNQIWIRTPFVTQLGASSDEGARRHALPQRDTRLGRLKYPGVAFQGWESPEKRTDFIAIDPKMTVPDVAGEGNANLCTSCHDIGKSRMLAPGDKEGTCQLFARPWFDEQFAGPVEGRFLTAHAATDRFWMPPNETVASAEAFRKDYALPLAALKSCCVDPLQASCQAWRNRPNPNL